MCLVYVIDPSVCEADKEIRDSIQRQKLAEVLETQQREREKEATQPRKCLFCKIVCDKRYDMVSVHNVWKTYRCIRSSLFRHMFAEHNFNIGLPDNIVDVNEFLNILEGKLTR